MSRVLEYESNPRGAHAWARPARRVGFILMCGMFGAVLARQQATSYTSVGYIQISPGVLVSSVPALQQSQAQHAAAIAGSTNLAAAAATLRSSAPTRVISPAVMAASLKVQTVPESKLIAVSYSDEQPVVAAAVARAVINSYVAANGSSVSVASPAGIPTVASHNGLFLAGGFAIGGAIGSAIVALRRK
jgi:uncharacterized protein involved in exopolysaccharide biosynthesis